MRYLTLIALLLCSGCEGCQGERKALQLQGDQQLEVDSVLRLSAPPGQAPFELVVDILADGGYDINFDDTMVSGVRAEFRFPGFNPAGISLEARSVEYGALFGPPGPISTRLTASEEGLVYDAELPGRGFLDLADTPLVTLQVDVTEEDGTRTLRFRTVGGTSANIVINAGVSGSAVVQGDNQVTLQHAGGPAPESHPDAIVLQCTGDGPADVTLDVQIDSGFYSMDASFAVDCLPPNAPAADVLDPGIMCPEGMSIVPAGYFGLTSDALAVSGKGGWRVLDLATGITLFEHNGMFDHIWVMAIGLNPYDDLDPQAMMAGGTGTGTKGWGDPQSSFLLVRGEFVGDTDGALYADGGGRIVTRFTSDVVFVTDTGQQFPLPHFRAFGEPDDMVSAHTAAAGKPVVAITDKSPGRFYAALAGETLAFIGEIGDEPRKIRTLCGMWVATNSASHDLSYGKIKDDGTAEIAPDRVAVGNRPIGLDLRKLPDGNVAAVTTDFGGNRYWITVFDPVACTVVSNDVFALPTGCVGPGHAIWGPEGELYISCYTSNNIAVIRPPA